MLSWISLHYVHVHALACPVENAWKCGTNAIVPPWPWSKCYLNRLVSYVEAMVDLVSMHQLHCPLEPVSTTLWGAKAVRGISGGRLGGRNRKAPHMSVRAAGLCSCWAHMRKEGRGDWDWETENQGHDLNLSWKRVALNLFWSWEKKKQKEWLHIFSLLKLSLDLAMSCCETTILKG